MGLTIYYTLRAPHVKSRREALEIVEALRSFARNLPVQKCGKITAWSNDRNSMEPAPYCAFVLPRRKGEESHQCTSVDSLESVRFAINHRGSETASFGLARFPHKVGDPEQDIMKRDTRLRGWNWQNFCKTQYASSSKAGGWDNFFAIHDSICRILDEAMRLGVKVKVSDEGGYWKDRDADKLKRKLDHYNELIAAFVGKFKDHMGDRAAGVVAPITEDPAFEQMEARGQKAWKKRGT